MSTNIQDYLVRTSSIAWTPLIEEGVDCRGISIKILRQEETGRAPSFLLKFEAGARYPYHNHPAGEELLVLEGSCIVEGADLQAGDYLYTPPSFKHSVTTKAGCILYLMVPEEVEILERE